MKEVKKISAKLEELTNIVRDITKSVVVGTYKMPQQWENKSTSKKLFTYAKNKAKPTKFLHTTATSTGYYISHKSTKLVNTQSNVVRTYAKRVR